MATPINLFVFGTTEWMSVFDTAATCFTGFLVARIYQSSLSKNRKLKDILIGETEDIRKQFQDWLGHLYNGDVDTGSVKAWLKLMSIRISHLMNHIPARFNVDQTVLQPYQQKLQELIVDNPEFDRQYKASKCFTPSDEFRRKLIMFQQENGHLFTKLIIVINNA